MRSAHFSVGAAPVESAEKGAHEYMRQTGLRPALSTNHAIITPTMTNRVAQAYHNLPDHDPAAVPAYLAMREETKRQFDHLTNRMGVSVAVHDQDPYGREDWTKVIPEARHDFLHNNRLDVLASKVTGGHPFFTNDENATGEFPQQKIALLPDHLTHPALARQGSEHERRIAAEQARGWNRRQGLPG